MSSESHTTPEAPTGVAVVSTQGGLLISWSAVEDATSYCIYWSTKPGVLKASGTQIKDVTTPYSYKGPSGAVLYFVVTALNNNGESRESDEVSALLDQPPVAVLSSPASAPTNQLVVFDASNSGDPDGNIRSYSLDYGDGQTATQDTAFFSHAYTKPGTYTVSLTVTDQFGATNTTAHLFTAGLDIKYPGSSIHVPSSGSGYQSFATGPDGTIHVFWIADGGIHYSRSRDSGATFEAARILESSDGNYGYGYYSFDYVTAIASANAVHICWTLFDSVLGGAEIFYAHSSDGGDTFSTPLMLSADDGIHSYAPSIASDRHGRISAAWNEMGGQYFEIFGISFVVSDDEGTTFSQPLSLLGGLGPAMALTGSNTYLSLTVGSSQAQEDIYFTASADAKTFTTPLNISHNPAKSWPPAMAAPPEGNVYVMWEEGPAFEPTRIMFARSQDNGGSFSFPLVLNKELIYSFCPSVVTGTTGKVYAVWSTSNDYYKTRKSYIVSSPDAGFTFSSPMLLPIASSAGGCPNVKAIGENTLGMAYTDQGNVYFISVDVSDP